MYCMEHAEGDMVGVLHNKRCAQKCFYGSTPPKPANFFNGAELI